MSDLDRDGLRAAAEVVAHVRAMGGRGADRAATFVTEQADALDAAVARAERAEGEAQQMRSERDYYQSQYGWFETGLRERTAERNEARAQLAERDRVLDKIREHYRTWNASKNPVLLSVTGLLRTAGLNRIAASHSSPDTASTMHGVAGCRCTAFGLDPACPGRTTRGASSPVTTEATG